MDVMFGLAMLLGIGPALALMYLVVRDYTFPRVEQPFFSDPTFFGLFVVGLVVGSALVMMMSMFRLSQNILYMVLFALVQVLAMVVVMNLRRFRGKSDSVFYGYGLGLGISSGMATGICFFVASALRDAGVSGLDASAIALIAIAVSMAMVLGAVGTNVGEGVARHMPMQYAMQGAIPLVVYNMLFTVVLGSGSFGGEVVYYLCMALMVAVAAVYFHTVMYKKLPGIVREVLKMEGRRRSDIPK